MNSARRALFWAHFTSGKFRAMILAQLFLGLAMLWYRLSQPPITGTGDEGRMWTEYHAGMGGAAVLAVSGLFGLVLSLAMDFPPALKTARGLAFLTMAVAGIVLMVATFVITYSWFTFVICPAGGVLSMLGLLGFFIRFRPEKQRRMQ